MFTLYAENFQMASQFSMTFMYQSNQQYFWFFSIFRSVLKLNCNIPFLLATYLAVNGLPYKCGTTIAGKLEQDYKYKLFNIEDFDFLVPQDIWKIFDSRSKWFSM